MAEATWKVARGDEVKEEWVGRVMLDAHVPHVGCENDLRRGVV